MVQNPKGGGLSATFGGGNQVMGVKTADFLEKATWYLVISLLIFSLASNIVVSSSNNSGASNQSIIQEQIDNSTIPGPSLPSLPIKDGLD